jgi:hypothetical protein
MPDEKRTGVIELESEVAAGNEPAHVSVVIDGDRRFIVRTADLASIGAQLRGKKSFSVFYSVAVPIVISLLTVIGATMVGQFFQYVSWRNSITLQQAKDNYDLAKSTYDRASNAMSAHYYAANVYLDAATNLANRKSDTSGKFYELDVTLDKQRFDAYFDEMKRWSESYDKIATDIEFNLDRPIKMGGLRISVRDFANFKCDQMLFSELQRLGLQVHSMRLQFAAIKYCFDKSMYDFKYEQTQAAQDNTYVIEKKDRDKAIQNNEDVRSLSNEFRCYAQHRIALFEERKQKAIFKLSTWILERIKQPLMRRAEPTDALKRALAECDFSKPAKAEGKTF